MGKKRRDGSREINCSLSEHFTKGATPQSVLKLLKNELSVCKDKVRDPFLMVPEGRCCALHPGCSRDVWPFGRAERKKNIGGHCRWPDVWDCGVWKVCDLLISIDDHVWENFAVYVENRFSPSHHFCYLFSFDFNCQRSALGTHGKLEGHILQKYHIWVRLLESGRWWPILLQIVTDPYCARTPGDRKVVWNSLSFRLHELHKQLLGTFLKMS